MAGPLSWHPNRKSRNGSRPLSRTPREHRRPWSTTPPIAEEEPMDEQTLNQTRRILRTMVLLVVDTSADAQEKMTAMLDSTDDARLAALAQEAVVNLKRVKDSYDKIEGEMREMRKALERIRTEHASEQRALAEAQKAVKQRDDLAVQLKELHKRIDPEKQQLEIMYAIDEATAKLKEEGGALRRELGQRQTEIETLRVSKKRLREALDRLAGKD